jgi:hypothetical protein
MESPARPPAQAAPTTSDRERVVQALSVQFANDRLTMDEFEDRLDRAYKALSVAQLSAVLADLPASIPGGLPAGTMPLLVPPSEVPPRGVLIAMLGGTERKGSWIVPRHLKVFAFMGGVELDLREASFGPGVTEIDVTVVMGGAEIILPPGVRVESFGAALMGGFEAQAGDATALSPLNPIVRLSGTALMGGVETNTRRPGEPAGRKARRGKKSHDPSSRGQREE